eukprot:4251017-Amphidinium_carterae.1
MLRLAQVSALPPWVFAYRPGRQAAELYFSMFLFSEQSLQWRDPLVVAKLDVKKAYDSVSHRLLRDALLHLCPDSSL